MPLLISIDTRAFRRWLYGDGAVVIGAGGDAIGSRGIYHSGFGKGMR